MAATPDAIRSRVAATSPAARCAAAAAKQSTTAANSPDGSTARSARIVRRIGVTAATNSSSTDPTSSHPVTCGPGSAASR